MTTSSPTSSSSAASPSTITASSTAASASPVVVAIPTVVTLVVVIVVLALILPIVFLLLVAVLVIMIAIIVEAAVGLPRIVAHVLCQTSFLGGFLHVLDVGEDFGVLSEGGAWSDIKLHVVRGSLRLGTSQSIIHERVDGLVRSFEGHCCAVIAGCVSEMIHTGKGIVT